MLPVKQYSQILGRKRTDKEAILATKCAHRRDNLTTRPDVVAPLLRSPNPSSGLLSGRKLVFTAK